jgi:hypothetical protein
MLAMSVEPVRNIDLRRVIGWEFIGETCGYWNEMECGKISPSRQTRTAIIRVVATWEMRRNFST